MGKAEKSQKQGNKKTSKPKPLSDLQMDKVAGGANKSSSSSHNTAQEDGKGG